MQTLVGILRGQTTADAYSVKLYLKKLDGLMLALNRIDFKAQSVGHVKNMLRDLIGNFAVKLEIVKMTDGQYEASGEEFPKQLIDFLIFYKLLIIICKLCIAKHDEALINGAILKNIDQQDKIVGECDALRLRIKNLEMIMPHIGDQETLKAVAEPYSNLVADLKENSKAMEKVITGQ